MPELQPVLLVGGKLLVISLPVLVIMGIVW